MSQEKFAEAVELLERTNEQYGPDKWLHYYLATAYEELDKPADTERHLKAGPPDAIVPGSTTALRGGARAASRGKTMAQHFDAIVIGTGQSGPALARRLTAAGRKVAVIERKRFGGTCVNNGCIPTKSLIARARAAHAARALLARFGLAGLATRMVMAAMADFRPEGSNIRHSIPSVDPVSP